MERVLAGEKLQRCRTEFLPIIPKPDRALLVGEGAGRFLTAFLSRFPQTNLVCLDASKKMLAESKRAIASTTGVEFIQADVFDWQIPEQKFDLIVTNFFLDCFIPNQLQIVVAKLAAAATQDATWLLSDFCEPSRGWKKWRARCILALMYRFFRLATKLPAASLTAPDPFLTAAGFQLTDRKLYDWGLLHADLWKRTPEKVQ